MTPRAVERRLSRRVNQWSRNWPHRERTRSLFNQSFSRLFATETAALVWSFVISMLAHFVVGAAKIFVTGRSWFKSGMEMTLVGLGAAIITYGVGLLIAPVLH